MVEGDSLAADCHVFCLVSVSIGDYLVVVGVPQSIQIEEVFHHLREIVIQLEYVVGFEVGSNTILAFVQH